MTGDLAFAGTLLDRKETRVPLFAFIELERLVSHPVAEGAAPICVSGTTMGAIKTL